MSVAEGHLRAGSSLPMASSAKKYRRPLLPAVRRFVVSWLFLRVAIKELIFWRSGCLVRVLLFAVLLRFFQGQASENCLTVPFCCGVIVSDY